MDKPRDIPDLSYADAVSLKAELKDEIKSSVKGDIRRWILHWFWLPVTLVAGTLGFFGWSSYKGLQELQTQILSQATKDFDRSVRERFSEANVSNRMDQLLEIKMSDYVDQKLVPLSRQATALQRQYDNLKDNLKPINQLINKANVKVEIETTNTFIGAYVDGGGTQSGITFLREGMQLLKIYKESGYGQGGNTIRFEAGKIDGKQSPAGLDKGDTLIVWSDGLNAQTIVGGIVSLTFNDVFCGELRIPAQTITSDIRVPITNFPVVQMGATNSAKWSL